MRVSWAIYGCVGAGVMDWCWLCMCRIHGLVMEVQEHCGGDGSIN